MKTRPPTAQVAISEADAKLVLRINAADKRLLHLKPPFCNHDDVGESSVFTV